MPVPLSQPVHEMIVETDVEIPLRDGARLRANVYRPATDARVPAILCLGAYQKDKVWLPPTDLGEAPNPHFHWETPNPLFWVPRGYALVRIDTRGSGRSPGRTDPWSPAEAQDFYDAIEWSATTAWSTGKTGLLGLSYHAMTQWLVANLKPPSLTAMIPWEGAADMYRDFAFHGGLFCWGFAVNWYHAQMAHHLLGKPQATAPDAFEHPWLWNFMRNNVDGDFYRGRHAHWDEITIPFLSAGNWSGMGLHLRGNVEGFTQAASPHKWLRIDSGSHHGPFYSEEGRIDQLRFFDHWLKENDTGLLDEPRIKLRIRKGGHGNHVWRMESEWPLARTEWTKFYLHAGGAGADRDADGTLEAVAPADETALTYWSNGMNRPGLGAGNWVDNMIGRAGKRTGVSFETPPLARDLEVTGPIVLTLWAASETEDMDVYATLRNIDRNGNDVFEEGQQGQLVPVAKGWLRASHRKLDSLRSLTYRPYHSHERAEKLTPGEPVRLEVEIWPTSMIFAAGHRIRLDVQPVDGIGSAPYTHYSADYNSGRNTLLSGGDRPSYLTLPIIPSEGHSV
jgi:predicted acyl esterase